MESALPFSMKVHFIFCEKILRIFVLFKFIFAKLKTLHPFLTRCARKSCARRKRLVATFTANNLNKYIYTTWVNIVFLKQWINLVYGNSLYFFHKLNFVNFFIQYLFQYLNHLFYMVFFGVTINYLDFYLQTHMFYK